MSESPSPVPRALDYAPATKRHATRRFRRAVMLLALMLLAIVVVQRVPEWWRQGQMLYWQRQCLNYTAAPDEVVYEEDQSKVAALVARGGEWSAVPGSNNPNSTNANAIIAVRLPDCYAQYRQRLASRFAHGGLICLHERQSKAGHRRLVAVYALPESVQASLGLPYPLFTVVIQPGTWNQSPAVVTGNAFMGSSWNQLSRIGGMNYTDSTPHPFNAILGNLPIVNPALRYFAGQPDPADRSHFTVGYERFGQKGTLDVWLEDDDSVHIANREGPGPV